jgi:hypothetical protein
MTEQELDILVTKIVNDDGASLADELERNPELLTYVSKLVEQELKRERESKVQ